MPGVTSTPRLVLDTRPLWRVVLGRTHHWIIMGLVALVFLFLMLHKPFEGLDDNGQHTLAVFAVCLILWVTQALPLSVTGLLALLLLPLTTGLDTRATYALFGSEAVFFILGAFIIAAAVMHTGLSTRVAVVILDRVGSTPRRLMLGFLFLSAALAHFMPEHAVAAMLLPIGLEIARALKLRPGRSKMGAGLFLGLAWGSIIGGIATYLGGARNPLALSFYQTATGESISFFEWWWAAMPLVFLSLLGASMLLLIFCRPEIDSTEPARLILRERMHCLGRMTLEEWIVAFVLLLTVLGWVFGEHIHVPLSITALAGAVALFAFRVIAWTDVENHVNWGVILMYGGAIALGLAMRDSGASEWLIRQALSDNLLANTALTVLVIALIALVLTEGISNSAVVALMLPLVLPLALPTGAMPPVLDVDPRLIVFSVALPAGLAFTLPISTPPNALAHSTGFVTVGRHGAFAVLMNLLCFIMFALVALIWWGPAGLKLW